MNYFLLPGVDAVEQIKNKFAAIDKVFRTVCDEFEQDPDYILVFHRDRRREYVEIRQITMYITKRLFPKYTSIKIAEFFNKNHATVLHGIKTVENLLDTDKNFRAKTTKIFEQWNI